MAQTVANALSSVIKGPPPYQFTSSILPSVQDYISWANSPDTNKDAVTNATTELEEKLQHIYEHEVDQTSPDQIECFLETLYALRNVFSMKSLSCIWTLLVIRPGLKNPKLRSRTHWQLRELLLIILRDISDGSFSELLRQKILGLFLSAGNEASGEEAIDDAALGEDERQRARLWKRNLEDVLLSDAADRPAEFFAQINTSFATPSARLQLCALLTQILQRDAVPPRKLIEGPLLQTLLTSLLLDNSTTLFEIETTILVLALPHLAVDEAEKLKVLIPRLFAVVGRALCWRRRALNALEVGDHSDEGKESREAANGIAHPGPALKEEVKWEVLDSVFDTAAPPPPPDMSQYFTFMYGLWPYNTIAFLRKPLEYLTSRDVFCPLAGGWTEVLDSDQVISEGRILLCSRAVHPGILFRDSAQEFADPTPWFASSNSISEIVAECMALDIRQTSSVPRRELSSSTADSNQSSRFTAPKPRSRSSSPLSKENRSLSIEQFRPQISIQNVIATHLALKSGIAVDIVDDPGSPNLMPHGSPMPAVPTPLALPSPISVTPRHPPQESTALQVALEAIASLQKELLLLRNELSFELWSKKKLVDHVQTLHRARVSTKKEETERQNLRNKLKDYKTEVAHIREQIKNNKIESDGAKAKYSSWVKELQTKLQTLRTEKASWHQEAVGLRSEVNEAKRIVQAQNAVLAEAQKNLFNLTAFQKENLPKIERIHEYQKKIEQLSRVQANWEDSDEVRTFREEKAKAEEEGLRLKHLELLVGSLENENKGLQEKVVQHRDLIQTLERKRAASASSGITGGSAPPSPTSARKPSRRSREGSQGSRIGIEEASSLDAKVNKLQNDNSELRKKNIDLQEEVEELKAMVEILRIDAEKWRSRFQSQTEAQQATQRKRLSTGPFGAVGSASLLALQSPAKRSLCPDELPNYFPLPRSMPVLPSTVTSPLQSLVQSKIHPTYLPVSGLLVLRAVRAFIRLNEVSRPAPNGTTPQAHAQRIFCYLVMNWGGTTLTAILLSLPPPWLYSFPIFALPLVTYTLLSLLPSLSTLLSKIPRLAFTGIDSLIRSSSVVSACNGLRVSGKESLWTVILLGAISSGGSSLTVSTFGLGESEWKMGVPGFLRAGGGWLDAMDLWAGSLLGIIYSQLLQWDLLTGPEARFLVLLVAMGLYVARDSWRARKKRLQVQKQT